MYTSDHEYNFGIGLARCHHIKNVCFSAASPFAAVAARVTAAPSLMLTACTAHSNHTA